MRGATSFPGWLWMLGTVSGTVLEALLLSGIIILWQKYLLARYLPALFELILPLLKCEMKNLKTYAWE